MAHAAPASGTRDGTGTGRPHPAGRQLPEGRGGLRRPGRAAWSLPLLLGVLYGFWAAQMDRNGGGNPRWSGPITTGNVFFGVISGLVVAALCFLLHRISHRLPPEARALGWGAFAGATLGYLYALTNASVVRTVVVGILTAAGVCAMTFYWHHTSRSA
jgi:hypothetical protein